MLTPAVRRPRKLRRLRKLGNRLVHAGRKTGAHHSTVAMVLRRDPVTGEAVICSVWGADTDWIRNIRARPAIRVQIGRVSFVPTQRFLTEDESLAVVDEFRREHPWRLRLFASVLGWADLRSTANARDFVRCRPFVSLAPQPELGRDSTG